MAKINTYLHFEGNTEEAFNFYKSVFGGEFMVLQRYGDVKNQLGWERIEKIEEEKIMHVALPIGKENVLMGHDALASMGRRVNFGNNFSISVFTESREEAEKIYGRLASGGEATMPLADAYWGAYFGMCADKFAVQWMVHCDNK